MNNTKIIRRSRVKVTKYDEGLSYFRKLFVTKGKKTRVMEKLDQMDEVDEINIRQMGEFEIETFEMFEKN